MDIIKFDLKHERLVELLNVKNSFEELLSEDEIIISNKGFLRVGIKLDDELRNILKERFVDKLNKVELEIMKIKEELQEMVNTLIEKETR